MTEPESTFTECYIAFLDLMGVKDLVKKCAGNPKLHRTVIAALQETKNLDSFFSARTDVETEEVKRWVLQVQAFSDCVVLFIPTESKMLSWMLASIRRLHDRLLELHVPLRGGITVGGMHWDDNWSLENPATPSSAQVAFGPGLVAAYDLETSVAVYPRILISDDLVGNLKKAGIQAKAFPLGQGSLRDYCRQDFDGLYHFDVLHPNAFRKNVESVEHKVIDGEPWTTYNQSDIPLEDWYAKVRNFIQNGRAKVKGEKLQAKFRWLARYYNSVVDNAKIGKAIRIFEDRIRHGTIPLTTTQRAEQDKKTSVTGEEKG
jgi:hypothetical protein